MPQHLPQTLTQGVAHTTSTKPPVSAAAQRFQRAWAQVERIQAQREDLNQRCENHLSNTQRLVHPLRMQHRMALRQLVLALAPWLAEDCPGLSRSQRATALTLACGWAEALARQGDADLAALYVQISPLTLTQKEQQNTEQLKQLLRQALGDDWSGEDHHDPATLLHAAHAHQQTQSEHKKARREQARAARQAKRAPSAQQAHAAATEQDAQSTLRTLYRQLASALHPDREPDPVLRQHKNDLMSKLNAANDRRDWVTMMHLQQQAALANPDHLDQMPTHRLEAVTLLLKQQAAELERDRQACQQRWAQVLQLPWPTPLSTDLLQRHLEAQLAEVTQQLHTTTQDLTQVQTLSGLKVWLNAHQATRGSRQSHQPPGPGSFR